MAKDIDIIAVGYPSLDRIVKIYGDPEFGKTSTIKNSDNQKIYYGGCNVNVAFLCSKLNLVSMPMMRVGDDFESSGYEDFLSDANVLLDGVEKIQSEYTSNTYLIENESGEHITLFNFGAMDDKYEVKLNEDLIKRAKYGIITIGSLAYNSKFADLCVKNNVPIIFGMKWHYDVLNEETLQKLLTQSQIIFMNESEEKEIIESLKLSKITDLLQSKYTKCLIITKGKQGSKIIYEDDKTIIVKEVPIVKPEKVIDTTGAGDAYLSGFVYGLINNKPYEECGRIGATISSYVIEAMGAITNAPTEKQLEKRHNNYKEI